MANFNICINLEHGNCVHGVQTCRCDFCGCAQRFVRTVINLEEEQSQYDHFMSQELNTPCFTQRALSDVHDSAQRSLDRPRFSRHNSNNDYERLWNSTQDSLSQVRIDSRIYPKSTTTYIHIYTQNIKGAILIYNNK